MNKNYYKKLGRAYFDAALSPNEEQRLMAFLAKTEDPDFDEVKAVAGFFAAGRTCCAEMPSTSPERSGRWRIAIAASLATIVAASVVTVSVQKRNRTRDLANMEETLSGFFSSGADVENTLADLFNQKR